MRKNHKNSLRLRNASEGNTRFNETNCKFGHFFAVGEYFNDFAVWNCDCFDQSALCTTKPRSHCAITLYGAAKSQILWAYLSLLGVVFLLAMLVGSAVGVGLGYGLLQLMLQLIPHLSIAFSAWDMLLGRFRLPC